MTPGSEHKSANEKLVHAYNRMMERVKSALEEAGKEAKPALRQVIEVAKDKAIELGEISTEEAERIAEYLSRDLNDAAEYLAGPEAEDLANWLRFDISLIEERLLEMFASVADQTKLELMALEERARRASEYHSGEITGIGTLRCQSCGKRVHFHATGHIPPCPKCHGSAFTRE